MISSQHEIGLLQNTTPHIECSVVIIFFCTTSKYLFNKKYLTTAAARLFFFRKKDPAGTQEKRKKDPVHPGAPCKAPSFSSLQQDVT